MENNVPYIVHEGIVDRLERMLRRLWILIIILVILLVGTNAAWLYYESQFETVETTTETYESDASDDGVAIANGNGEVDYNG